MKSMFFVCIGSLFLVGSSLAETRSFTNKEGKALTAELIRVEGESAVLKLANSSRVNVPIASLSDSDQQFIKTWWEENKNNVTEMDLRLEIDKKSKRISRSDSGDDKGKKGGDQKKASVDEIQYSCVLKSYTPRDISDISVDYTIYKRISTRGEDGSETTTETTDGSAKIASIPGNQSATFETTGVTCEDVSQKPSRQKGAQQNAKKATSKRETVIGVVFRLSANGKEFLEQSDPENFMDKLKEDEERAASE